jgi:hypothetical protein
MPTYHKVIRYINNASDEKKGANVITSNCIMNLMTVGSSTSLGRTIFGAVRITSVSVWAVPSVSNWESIQITWYGAHNSNGAVTATGDSSRPAALVSRPPKKSYSEEWIQIAQAPVNLFSISGNTDGCCVDLAFSFQLFDDDATLTAPSLSYTTTISPGFLAYNALDSATLSGTLGSTAYGPIGIGNSGFAYGL